MSEDSNYTSNTPDQQDNSDLSKFFPNLARSPVPMNSPHSPQPHPLLGAATASPPPIPVPPLGMQQQRIPTPIEIMAMKAAQQQMQLQQLHQQQIQQQQLQQLQHQRLQQQQLHHLQQLPQQLHPLAMGAPVPNRPMQMQMQVPFGFPPQNRPPGPHIQAPLPIHPITIPPFQNSSIASPGMPKPIPTPTIPVPPMGTKPESTSKPSTPAKPKRQERFGVRLTGKDITYMLDNSTKTSTKSRKQLEATPITLYNSENVYHLGSQIAVNDNYICYAVRGNMIRVLSRHKSIRTLVKGEQPVVDLRFFSDGVDLLASSSKDGSVFVWNVTSTAETVAYPNPDYRCHFQRLAWHPHDSNIIACAGNDNSGVYIWNLNALKGEAGDITIIDRDEIEGSGESRGLRLLVSEAEISDFSFSASGKYVAAGCVDGKVRLWDLEAEGNGCTQEWSVTDTVQPVTAALFIAEDLLVTATDYNSVLRLWDVKQTNTNSAAEDDEANNTVPSAYLQSLSFIPASKEDKDNRENTAFNGHIGVDPSGKFLFVASTKSCVGYILHLDTPHRHFDHLLEFGVTQPILSFTVTARKVSKETQAHEEDSVEQLYLELYCIQPKAIQLYEAKAELCVNPPEGSEEDSASQETDNSHIIQTGGYMPTTSLPSSSASTTPPSSDSSTSNSGSISPVGDGLVEQSALAMSEAQQPPSLLQLILNSSSAPPASPSTVQPAYIAENDAQERSDIDMTTTITDEEQAPEVPSFIPDFTTAPRMENTEEQQSVASNIDNSIPPSSSEINLLTDELPTHPSPQPPTKLVEDVPSPTISMTPFSAVETEVTTPTAESAPKSPSVSSVFDFFLPKPNPPSEAGASSPNQRSAQQPVLAEQVLIDEPTILPIEQVITATTAAQPSTVHKPTPKTRQPRGDRRKEAATVARDTSPTSPQKNRQQQTSPQKNKQQVTVLARPAPIPPVPAALSATQPTTATTTTSPSITILPRQQKEKKDHTEQQSASFLQSPSFFTQPTIPPQSSSPTPIDGQPIAGASAADVLKLANNNSAAISDFLAKDMRRIENNILFKDSVFPQAKQADGRSCVQPKRGRLEKILQQQNARIEKERVERERLEKERAERLLTVISQTFNTNLQQNMERVVKKELATILPPLLEKTVATSVENSMSRIVQDSIKKSLQGFTPKMESTLTEGLNRTVDAVKNQVGASLEGVVENAVRQPVQQAFMKYFTEVLAPSFEQSCQTMFRQLHNSFTQGVKEVSTQIASSAANNNNNNAPLAGQAVVADQMRIAVQTLVDVATTMSASIVDTQGKMLSAMRAGTPNPSALPYPTSAYDTQPQQQTNYPTQPNQQQQLTLTSPHVFPPIHPPHQQPQLNTQQQQQPQQLQHSYSNPQLHNQLQFQQTQQPQPQQTLSSSSSSTFLSHLHSSSPSPQPTAPQQTQYTQPQSQSQQYYPTSQHTSLPQYSPSLSAISSPSLAPSSAPQGVTETLQRLVAGQRWPEAFDAALSSVNLNVVVWLCEAVGDPKNVFATQRLSQPIVLSLIQQLGYLLSGVCARALRAPHLAAKG